MLVQSELSGFTVLGQLGLGGTAEVLRVYASSLGREAALKIPRHDGFDGPYSFGDLVQREFQLIGTLRFPGLVRLHDVSVVDPQYLLMELCPGTSLETVGRIDDLQVALSLVSAIAIDLEFLRTQRLVHGDLKPHNVYLPVFWRNLPEPPLRYVKLADFSFGRPESEPEDSRLGLGTVGYMAPEVLSHSQTSHASDLFALGVIAYQLLTGRHPFMDPGDPDPVRVNSRIREGEVAPSEGLRPDVDKRVHHLIRQLLAVEPKKRPASAWQVCEALEQAGAGYPFRKAIRPAHLTAATVSYEECVAASLGLEFEQRGRLDTITRGRTDDLRLVLDSSFRRGAIVYDPERCTFCGRVLWPHRVRSRVLSGFGELAFGERRQAARAAVAGGGNQPVGERSLSPALSSLLLPFLRLRTVRQQSHRAGRAAEQREAMEDASRLYVQAGDLKAAERCAHQAAMTLHKEHESARAIRTLARVVELAQLRGEDHAVRHLIMQRADILKDLGEVERAGRDYERIVEMYRDLAPDALLAEAYKDIGDLCKLRQDHRAGLQALEKAEAIYRQTGSELEVSHVLNNMGNIHWITGDLGKAMKHYRRAMRIQKRLESWPDVGSSLTNIASVATITGRIERGIRLYELSLRLKKRIGHKGEIARSLNNLGYAYHLKGHNDRAVECLEESLELNRAIGSKKELLYNYENLTTVMIAGAQLRRALDFLKEGTALAETLEDKPHRATFLISAGSVLTRMGKFSQAAEHFDRASRLASSLDDHILEVVLALGQSHLRSSLGDRQNAVVLASRALAAAEKAQDQPSRLDALLALVRLRQQEHAEAALTLARELGQERVVLLLEYAEIDSNLESGRAIEQATATRLRGQLEKLAQDIEVAGLCRIAAEYELRHGDIELAAALIERASREAQNAGLVTASVGIHLVLGKTLARQGEYERAFAQLRSALDAGKRIAEGIIDERDRTVYSGRTEFAELAAEIKTMASMLGQKQRGGSLTPSASRVV